MIIVHFTEKNIWEEESNSGYFGDSVISYLGHIPCFYVQDLEKIDLNLSTLRDYVILCIDTSRLENTILDVEPFKDTSLNEPIIKAKIPTDAVVSVLPYTFDSNDKFVPRPELLDFQLINNVLEKLDVKYESHKYFHDGTDSKIILLNNDYVIKKSLPNIIKAQVQFASEYKSIPMLQKLACYDDNYEYVVYHYIAGDVMHSVQDFEDVAAATKRIVSYYKEYKGNEWGFLHSPSASWQDFLEEEVSLASSKFHEADDLLPAVHSAIIKLSEFDFKKKLIHGDFCADNFIKLDDRFVAAIDATPVAGDALYDLITAIVSNVDMLPYINLNFLVNYTEEPKEKVLQMLKIVLFIRICKSASYDKDTYLDFWETMII